MWNWFLRPFHEQPNTLWQKPEKTEKETIWKRCLSSWRFHQQCGWFEISFHARFVGFEGKGALNPICLEASYCSFDCRHWESSRKGALILSQQSSSSVKVQDIMIFLSQTRGRFDCEIPHNPQGVNMLQCQGGQVKMWTIWKQNETNSITFREDRRSLVNLGDGELAFYSTSLFGAEFIWEMYNLHCQPRPNTLETGD